MSLILGIETGTDVCSVSLSDDNGLIALRETVEGRDHSTKLAIFIDEILKGNDLEPSDLDAVAVSKGPGSYTGLRIGVSTAKGLCYGLGIPLIAVGSLESLCRVALEDYRAGILGTDSWEDCLLCPMIDARRMEVYMQVFDTDPNPVGPVRAEIVNSDTFSELSPEFRKIVLFGNGSAKCREILQAERFIYADVTPSARGLVASAHDAYLKGDFVDTAYFEPDYLKDFVVTTSKKKLF